MKRSLIGIASIVATGFLLSVGPGCVGSSPASPAETAEARKVLDRALTAWQEGKPVDSLKNEQPPLDASDHQWSNGLHLVKYEVQNDHLTGGSGQSFRAILWLKDHRSKRTKVMTQYDVTTSPLRVVRAGF